jgi:acetolactate decarboxylase
MKSSLMHDRIRFITRSLALVLLLGTARAALAQNGPVIATGAMRNTMFNGQLSGLIALDSIASPGIFGLGPLEYLQGELMLIDGTCHVSSTTSDSTIQVVTRSNVRAPFFVHQRVTEWTEVALPAHVTDLASLDGFLTSTYGDRPAPFAFRLNGTIRSVQVHVLAVPDGTEVRSPADAHAHNTHFRITDREVEAIGFFSTQHKTIFTHHDSHIHVHAITAEKDWMGHVEALGFDPERVSLWVATGETGR